MAKTLDHVDSKINNCWQFAVKWVSNAFGQQRESRNKVRLPGCFSVALTKRQEFAAFYVTSHLYKQFFLCGNFYLSQKLTHQLFSRYICHIKIGQIFSSNFVNLIEAFTGSAGFY